MLNPHNNRLRRELSQDEVTQASSHNERLALAASRMRLRSLSMVDIRLGLLKYVPQYIERENQVHEQTKIIWQYWNQGRQNAPEIVKSCLNSVERHGKNFQIIMLDDGNLNDYIELPKLIREKLGFIPIAHLSDLIRLLLLQKFGGLWIDATVFLTDGIPDTIQDSPFFAFTRPSDPFLFSSWFLKSTSQHALTEIILEALLNYWKENDTLCDYFLFHHMFEAVTEVHPSLRELWCSSPIFSSHDAHLMQHNLHTSIEDIDLDLIMSKSFAHKLTYKLENKTLKVNSLFSSICMLSN